MAPTMALVTPTVLLAIGGAVAFFLSAALGANDVANSLGTSVGTGAVKVSQALLIGAVMEFSGAVLFGSTVTQTVSAGVVSVSAATLANPVGYMVGMLSVLVGCTLWMATATKLGLPVSSTHAVVGSLVGIGLVSGWGVNVSAVTNIVASWFLSPFIGGAVAVTLYAIIRRYILKAPRPAKAIRHFLPLLSGFASFVLSLFILFKGAPFAAIPKGNLLAVAAAISAFVSGIALALSTAIHSRTYIKAELGVPDDAETPDEMIVREQGDVERIFKVLQVVTACLLAFSHGSNDVSNAIGPFAAMYSMWANGGVGATVAIPLWVLVLGGIGISTGLAVWGRPVMETVGKKITSLVPTKGFAVELSTALTVLIASEFGLPVSTTQVLVGCIVAIGLSSGDKDAVNGGVLKNIALSWGVTLPVSAAISVAFYLLCQPLLPPVVVATVASRLAAVRLAG